MHTSAAIIGAVMASRLNLNMNIATRENKDLILNRSQHNDVMAPKDETIFPIRIWHWWH